MDKPCLCASLAVIGLDTQSNRLKLAPLIPYSSTQGSRPYNCVFFGNSYPDVPNSNILYLYGHELAISDLRSIHTEVCFRHLNSPNKSIPRILEMPHCNLTPGHGVSCTEAEP